MADHLDALQTILSDVDRILRERLAEIGARVAHVVVAIDPEGSTIVLGNILPAGLKEMGAELIELAEEGTQLPANDEPIH